VLILIRLDTVILRSNEKTPTKHKEPISLDKTTLRLHVYHRKNKKEWSPS